MTHPTLFIMLDGLRPDAAVLASCPNLDALRRRGASTLTATSVMPSITLPCHMSIFHSVPPTRHGITSNDWMPMARPLPGLVEVARLADRRCAFIYNWEPLRNLSRPGSLSFSLFRDTAYDLDGDDGLAEEAIRLLSPALPDFTFLYFGTIDTAGHFFGWLSDEYLAQAKRVDAALGRVLEAVPDGVTVLVQSDHGGHDRFHGSDLPEDMTIPWIIAGPGIRPGYTIASPVSLLDTAPTLARVLGFFPHREWEGRCIDDVFM